MKKFLTKEDLHAFYLKILPFLSKVDSGGSGGGHTIEDSTGTDLTQRDTLQFGEGFLAEDDDTNEKTVILPDVMQSGDMDDVITPLPSVAPKKEGIKYSTTEQVVGEWIDGKPLYQKTFVYNTATSGTTDVIVGQIQNMDVGFVVDGFYINQNVNFGNKGSMYMLNNTGRNAPDTSYDSYFMVTTDGTIVGFFGSNSASSKIVVTIRYTKTTDTPNT